MTGKVVLITGANAGIGKETAVGLARMGATVVMTSRDAGRGAEALADVRSRSGSTEVELFPLDLAELASVRACATEVLERHQRLDVLVDNAGLVMAERTVTHEGFETTFGVNHLGHFYLTNLLLDRLRASAPARVVVVASQAHKMVRGGLDFDDLQSLRHYRGFDAYSKSKLANLYFTRELARHLAGTGVTVERGASRLCRQPLRPRRRHALRADPEARGEAAAPSVPSKARGPRSTSHPRPRSRA